MRRTKYAAIVLCCCVSAVSSAASGQTSNLRVVYYFQDGADSAYPSGKLLDVGGKLYGTTSGAATAGITQETPGAVFSVDPATGAETTLYTFQGGVDGQQPNGSLVDVNGTLYGTTQSGGSAGYGTVFSVDIKSGHKQTVHSFQGGGDGATPTGGLTDVNGVLYGTTSGDKGETSFGTLFSINPTSETETVLFAFQGTGFGVAPKGNLLNVAGTLYGVTGTLITSEGPFNGTVFEFSPTTNIVTPLHTFGKTGDGSGPNGYLIKLGNVLYGTTAGGGASYDGTVFSVNITSHKEAVLYSFQGGSDGQEPYSGLTSLNGLLYGTTVSGGANGFGTVFSLNIKTKSEVVVHSFYSNSDGYTESPFSGFVAVNSVLYSLATGGGYNYGSVYSFTP